MQNMFKTASFTCFISSLSLPAGSHDTLFHTLYLMSSQQTLKLPVMSLVTSAGSSTSQAHSFVNFENIAKTLTSAEPQRDGEYLTVHKSA
jgi:hypothetical protein